MYNYPVTEKIVFYFLNMDKYVIFFPAVGEAIANGHHWYVSRNFLQSVVAICFLLPLCLPKHMGVLSYTR